MNVCYARVALYSLIPLFGLSTLCQAQQGVGVKNLANREWQVRYHVNDPNKTGDIALRLLVAPVTGRARRITATLWRYDDKDGGNYILRNDGGGQISMTGSISKNQGEGSRRKREQFELKGNYTDTDGKAHVVKIFGYHYAGKNKAAANRNDDQLVICMSDKTPNELAAKAAMTSERTGDCDEQPPDEDVLTEDPPADPPVYDPEDP